MKKNITLRTQELFRLVAVLFSTILLPASLLAQGFFMNPVIRGDVADPTIIRIGETYYAAGTSSEWAPHYPLFRSTDLVNWEQIGHIFEKKPEWASSSFWAPELFVHQGKVYCYYTARSKKTGRSYVGVAVAESLEGEFVDYGPLVDFGSEDIDAFVFDDDGQLYITWKAYGLDPRPIELLCQPLSADGLRLEGEAVTLLIDDDNIGMEGQCIFRKDGWYYLLYAARGCCGPGSDYEVRVARSRTVYSAFTPYEDNPILMGNANVLSLGHGTLVETPDGHLFYLCHAYLRGEGFYCGRQPVLQELFVGSDEWPHFMTGRLASLRQPLPFADTEQRVIDAFDDEFDGATLAHEWTWNYAYSDVAAQLSNGQLILSARGSDSRSGAALCVRPFTTLYECSVTLSSRSRALSGLTFYGDNRHHVVFGCKGRRIQLVSRRAGDEVVLMDRPCKGRKIYLKMHVSDGCRLSFYYSADGKEWTEVETGTVDGSGVMQWDRISRPGVYTEVADERGARFDRFSLHATQ